METTPFRENLFGQRRDDVGDWARRLDLANLRAEFDLLEAAVAAVPQGELGYAQATTNQTGITTVVDITGLSKTVTAAANRKLKVTLDFHAQSNNAGSRIDAMITDGSNNLLQIRSMSTGSVNLNSRCGAIYVVEDTGAGGSLTYKGRIQDGAGVGTIVVTASAGGSAFILVEDVGAA